MPTYQYACTNCDERIEVVQKFTDDPLTECAACGSRLRKVFSPVGIVFKGSGFYRTDSRATANGRANGSKGETKDKEPAASGETSSDQSGSADASAKSDGSKSSSEPKSSASAGGSDSGASSSRKGTEKVA